MLLKNYPEGSDVTILNNFYCYPKKNEETGKWDNGSMTLIYKDNITGKKYNECIDNPDYEYYVSDKPLGYHPLFKHRDEVRKVTTPFTKLEKSIAEETFVYGRGRNLHAALPGRGETARPSSEGGPLAVLSSITTVWDRFLQGEDCSGR